jgi:SAM-dependent methyltransferase
MRRDHDGRDGLEPMSTAAPNPFGIDGYCASTYGDAFADIYDEWYRELHDNDFVEGICASLPDSPRRVLELGVGTGRLIRQWLACRPHSSDQLIGVDSSDAMLAIARAQSFPLSVELALGDFSQSLPDGPFDIVFVGYNTLFNLPNKEAIRSCFSLVASSLSPTGRFFIDAVIPRGTHAETVIENRTMPNGNLVESHSTHDPVEQRITGKFVHDEHSSSRITRPWSVRYFTPTQLDTCAIEAGMTLVSRYSDGNNTTFTSDSSRHITQYSRPV